MRSDEYYVSHKSQKH